MKIVALAFGLCIATVGAAGLLLPSLLVWIARVFVSAGALGFYVLAALRIAFGLVLIAAAASSRAPRAVRILGYAIVSLGIVTAIFGLTAVTLGGDMIESWLEQGTIVARLTALPIALLGGFVAYACAPTRSAMPT